MNKGVPCKQLKICAFDFYVIFYFSTRRIYNNCYHHIMTNQHKELNYLVFCIESSKLIDFFFTQKFIFYNFIYSREKSFLSFCTAFKLRIC